MPGMSADFPPAIADFLAAFDAAVAAGVGKPGPLSSRLFGASDRVDEIRAGRPVGVYVLHRASETLAALDAQARTGAASEARLRGVA